MNIQDSEIPFFFRFVRPINNIFFGPQKVTPQIWGSKPVTESFCKFSFKYDIYPVCALLSCGIFGLCVGHEIKADSKCNSKKQIN